MFNVALTGNIAAGKSSVVDLLRRWGATVIDADALAREAQAPGGEVLAAIVRRFGADVLAPDGALDRGALRAKVMGDQAALDALNQIVHPAVRRRRDELLREARDRGTDAGGAQARPQPLRDRERGLAYRLGAANARRVRGAAPPSGRGGAGPARPHAPARSRRSGRRPRLRRDRGPLRGRGPDRAPRQGSQRDAGSSARSPPAA